MDQPVGNAPLLTGLLLLFQGVDQFDGGQEPVHGELLIQERNQRLNCSAPVRKFGLKNALEVFELPQSINRVAQVQVRHTFGFGFPALPA